MSTRWNRHPTCPGGCGELADECACPPARRNPLGSIRMTPAAGGTLPPPPRTDTVPAIISSFVQLIPCCEHCGCVPGTRLGHDDTCRFGCNDEPACTCGQVSGLQPDCPQHGRDA